MEKWKASFWGKHSSFADFIDLCPHDQVVKSLIAWLDGAFRRGAQSFREAEEIRFWIAPSETQYFMCAMITQSGDSCGRKSPAFLAIHGRGVQCAGDWPRYSAMCRQTWNGMRKVIEREVESLAALKRSITRLPVPNTRHPADACPRDEFEAGRAAVATYLHTHAPHVIAEKDAYVEIPQPAGGQLSVQGWSAAMADRIESRPQSMFLSRSEQSTRMWIFYRPLMEADIHRMLR